MGCSKKDCTQKDTKKKVGARCIVPLQARISLRKEEKKSDSRKLFVGAINNGALPSGWFQTRHYFIRLKI